MNLCTAEHTTFVPICHTHFTFTSVILWGWLLQHHKYNYRDSYNIVVSTILLQINQGSGPNFFDHGNECLQCPEQKWQCDNAQSCWGGQYIDITVHSLQRNSVFCQKCHITEFTYSFRNARPTIPTKDKIHQTIHIARWSGIPLCGSDSFSSVSWSVC